jgi:hypothetical protein
MSVVPAEAFGAVVDYTQKVSAVELSSLIHPMTRR